MSDFKAKMHQSQKFGWGYATDPAGELTYAALPRPIAGFKGPTSKGREGKGRGKGGEGRVGKRKGEGGERGREGCVYCSGVIGAPASNGCVGLWFTNRVVAPC